MTLEREQLQAAAAGATGQISNRLGDVWWSLLIRGLLAVALGLVALFWPKATLALLVRLIGLYVLFDGILSLLAAFRAKDLGAYLGPGLVSLVVGLILLFWPDVTGRLLMVIVGLWALFNGVVLFLAGRQTDPSDPDRGLTITMGAVAAIVGVVLVIWPTSGVVTISWIIAIAALLLGGLLVFLAMRIKGVEKRVDDIGRPS